LQLPRSVIPGILSEAERVSRAAFISSKWEDHMTSTTIRTLLFAGIIAVLTAPAAAAVTTPGGSDARAAKATNMQLAAGPVRCVIDQGQGRFVPCEVGYMAAHPMWPAGDQCYTDEGQGRYVPCEAGYKMMMKKKLEEEQQQKK
jgi:hypothetical protein